LALIPGYHPQQGHISGTAWSILLDLRPSYHLPWGRVSGTAGSIMPDDKGDGLEQAYQRAESATVSLVHSFHLIL